MRKQILGTLVVLVILLLSLNLAESKLIDYKEHISVTKYYEDDDVSVTRQIYANYDNDNRFSTYDYRHGYSYRTSQDYWERHHDYDNYFDDYYDYDNYDKRDYKRTGRDSYGRNRYYEHDWDYGPEYVPYLRQYELRRRCYDSPPDGSLFYTKCR